MNIEHVDGNLTYGLVEVRRDQWVNWVRRKGLDVCEKLLTYLTEKVEWRMYTGSLFESTIFPYLLHHSNPKFIRIEGSAIRFGDDRVYGVGSLAFVFDDSRYVVIVDDEKLLKEINEIIK